MWMSALEILVHFLIVLKFSSDSRLLTSSLVRDVCAFSMPFF